MNFKENSITGKKTQDININGKNKMKLSKRTEAAKKGKITEKIPENK